MNTKPILFSGPMVRALLDGSKTQTRRILPTMQTLGRTEYPGKRDKRGYSQVNFLDTPEGIAAAVRECRYGTPGDQLWVRECYSGDAQCNGVQPRFWVPGCPIWYWSDGKPKQGDWTRPKPGMHMPRWASRITLEISGVRVERLQDISERDAMEEGCGFLLSEHEYWDGDPDLYRKLYRVLWKAINGAESWDANPWVWVVEFKRVPA